MKTNAIITADFEYILFQSEIIKKKKTHTLMSII